MKSILTYTSLFSWISLSLWVFLPTNSLAQSKDECMSKITKAEEYYSAGLFDQVLKLGLIPCLEADLKRDDKSRALKLLVLIKLYREEQDSALYFMQQLLDNDPEYSPSVIDPIEFENLHRRFDTAPIRLIEFRAGINLNIPIRDPNGAYTVGPNPASQNLNYFSKVGFHAGILWEKPILERPSKPFGLNFSTGAAYQFRQFQHSESLPYIESFDPNGDNSFELTFFEQQHWIDLPVSLHLNVRRNLTARIDNLEIYPYFSFGIVGHYLLSANLRQVQRTLVNIPSSDNDKQFEKRTLQVTTDREALTGTVVLRKRFNLSGQIGAGLQIKIGHNYLTLSSNVLWMTRNLVNESERMSNSQLVYTYGYVDDDFVQMLPQFSIGVKRIIYNPRLINP